MGIVLEIERQVGWIMARMTGAGEIAQVTRQFARLAEECQGTRKPRLLLDLSGVDTPLTAIDRFELGREAVAFAQHEIQVAVIAAPHQLHSERFGELVAQNRGVKVRVFADRSAGEAWLGEDKSPPEAV